MSNETPQAEKKDTPVAQPAPEAGSAPALKTEAAAGGIETAPAGGTESSKPAKGVEVEFFKLRDERRKLREDAAQKAAALAERDAEIAKLKAQLEPSKQGKDDSRSDKGLDETKLFENPKEVLDQLRKDAAKDALELVKQERLAEQERVSLEKEMRSAGEMLLTRSHIASDPNFAREVGALLNMDPAVGPVGKYAHLAEIDPHAAALRSYLDVCEAKGVSPDFSKKSTAQNATAGIKPSAAGVGEAPIITPDDIRKGKYTEADVRKAIDEGRYKGKTIKI